MKFDWSRWDRLAGIVHKPKPESRRCDEQGDLVREIRRLRGEVKRIADALEKPPAQDDAATTAALGRILERLKTIGK